MYAFIEMHRHEHGVEPICRVLQIAPSSYYAHKQAERDPSCRAVRRHRDATLTAKIDAVYRANYEVDGVRKVWRPCKAEVIHRRGPWRGVDDVEYATLEWVAWFNQQRLLEPLGYLPPAAFEEHSYHAHAAHMAVVVLT